MLTQRQLGTTGIGLPPLGLGCMGMSDMYGPTDRAESLATLDAAIEQGLVLLDTGDFYGMGHNELLLREALGRYRREDLFIAVKFGPRRAPDGTFLDLDCSPAAVQSSLAYTLARLGTDYVDLYQPARIDPNVPVEETVGAIKAMQEAGHVRFIGLSEASAATLRRAHREARLAWLQIEYSLLSRHIEADILPACRELGITLNAYGVLCRGLLSDQRQRWRSLTSDDIRAHLPRFQGANLDNNLALVQALDTIAGERGVTAGQLALAWVLNRDPCVVPLIGARKRDQLNEALAALEIELTADDRARIEAAVPPSAVAGARYDAGQMALLDSER